jgi:DNA-binding winged helix-turn-helix (wHTH) protein
MNDGFDGILRFERFHLDVKSQELLREGVRIPIQLQPFKLLVYLALHQGETISRETLRSHLWSKHTFVNFEAGLNFCIRQIRRALGENARCPRLIETLNRRGYRLLAPVERIHRVPQSAASTQKIELTFRPENSLIRDGREMERLGAVIAQLLVASYSDSHGASLAASFHGDAGGYAQAPEAAWNADVQAMLGGGVMVRINRGDGAPPHQSALQME